MNINLLIYRSKTLSLQSVKNIPKYCYSTSKFIKELEVEETPVFEIEPKHDEDFIKEVTNKSRLSPAHRNMLNHKKPYNESLEYYHDTVWYKKRLLGRYGIEATGDNPALVWPTKAEIEDKMAYEQVAYPLSLQESWKQIEEKKKQEALDIKQREEEIDKVVANFDKWRQQLQEKIAKKEAAILAAKEKKERLLQEVREQFGYYIDPKNEKFQEMLELKQKEDRKKKKEERKKKQAERYMAYFKNFQNNNTAMDKDSAEDTSDKTKSQKVENNKEEDGKKIE